MTKGNYSPVAIIEVTLKGKLLAINQAGITLFSLPDELLDNAKLANYYFDYYRLLNLDPNIPISTLQSTIIILNQQYYFLQIFDDISRFVLVIQPIGYLKSRLVQVGVANQQAFNVFCAQSESMQKLLKQAKAFAKQKEPLLISGATGTGKDLLALACHQYSQRGDKVLLSLNCAAMPDEVVESELYGYAAGAYQGVSEGKKGFFEQANGGSVLLDGIDEMSFRMQTKLIRFINDGAFRRVGDDNEVHVDVRVICITKADLFSLVKQGKFREDLYYRLNVLPLHLPLLNERKEDIIDLAGYFIHEFANKQSVPVPTLTEDAKTKLLSYHWPGNVRELKNVLYSALAQLNGIEITAKGIELPNSPIKYSLNDDLEGKTLDEITKQFEKTVLMQLYKSHPSSRKLSKRLGISHTAVANKLREYGIGK
ncbi:sigma 54-interacting transcriptional regulator [Orbus sturtevantii]|uniref:sigma 54-interacting transcriptional regulator n=1 Tax=Orbus sturtevantii TaxID=3074109 RepID=UPI00370D103E